MARFRVAVVGLGAVSESHLDAYRELDCVELVGVVEPRADRRRELAERYDVPGFASCNELFVERRPEIASVLTPAATHRQVTEECAAAGVHVLCEKPLAVTLEDARAMAEACRRAGVQLFYGSSYRFLPAIEEARKQIAARAIGEVRLIVEQVLTGEGSSAYRPMSEQHYPLGGPGGGGYGLVDHGIHMLDIFPWLCGSRIDRVLGRGDRTGAAALPEFALMTLECGAFGVLLYDQSTRAVELPGVGLFSEAREWVAGRGWVGESGKWDPHPREIAVYGSEGALRVFPYANKLLINRSGGLQSIPLRGQTTPWHFGTQLREFCRTLDAGEAPRTSAEDGILALKALLSVYESEATGRWQSIRPD